MLTATYTLKLVYKNNYTDIPVQVVNPTKEQIAQIKEVADVLTLTLYGSDSKVIKSIDYLLR